MSGVWKFQPNGVVKLVENPPAVVASKKLVHVATNEVMSSYDELGRKLMELGWERYYDDPELLQFHKSGTVHLISLPKDFSRFRSVHMYDIVVKNRHSFEVRDR